MSITHYSKIGRNDDKDEAKLITLNPNQINQTKAMKQSFLEETMQMFLIQH